MNSDLLLSVPEQVTDSSERQIELVYLAYLNR